MRLAYHMICMGRVQGVFYRASTKRKADELGLTGWVRNLPNGDVEVMAYGEKEELEALYQWCKHGPPMASVIQVIKVESHDHHIPEHFEVRY